jgi:phosphatidylserine/phosphatidylglycerophosphate/cardiolipin synthase-like enzyme
MSSRDLNFMADFIEDRRIPWPPDAEQLRASGVTGANEEDWQLLERAIALGSTPATAAWMLRQVANERTKADTIASAVQPVVSGPCRVSGLRSTEDAFREIIEHAKKSILITGFALHNGPSVLARLAQRMDSDPAFDVVLCLDISRGPGDTSHSQALIAGFVAHFRQAEWPGRRTPRLFFDPRSLAHGADERSVLHAKIAIADWSRALVGSANLTEAALKRNIEIGLLVSLPAVVSRIREHIEALIHGNILVPAPL